MPDAAAKGLQTFFEIPTTWREISSLLFGQGLSLGRLPQLLGRIYAERPALQTEKPFLGISDRLFWTYAQVEDAVAHLAAAFQSLGVSEGRRVLISIDNRLDLLFHLFALARAGGLPVPINPRLKAAEFAAIVDATHATMLLTDGDILTNLLADGVLPKSMAVLWTGHAEIPRGTAYPSLLQALRQTHEQRCLPGAEIPPDKPSLILCTSGTTGRPKAALLSSVGLLGSIGRLLAAPVGHPSGWRKGRDILFCALPLTHVMGISSYLGGLCAGIKIIHQERFQASVALATIERERPNVFIGVPTMYADLEREGADTRDLSSIQLWISGADVMPPERVRRFQRLGAMGQLLGRALGSAFFADIYGMVELSGPMAIRLYPSSPTRSVEIPSISLTLPGFEVRAIDGEGKPLGWGHVGILQAKGPGVLQAYEGFTSEGPDPEGWFTTGDLARIWPGGLFSFAGRSRDRLKVSGFSVFPAEVEAILAQYPGIREVALVGLPDERTGDRPVALVLPAGLPFDRSAFLAWARENVVGYRRPHEAYLVEALPRGAHGKLDRAAATSLAQTLASASSYGGSA